METRNQRLIREILGDAEESSDTSLRAQTLRRAQSREVPRTLTAFEWEQWYDEHGIPAKHRDQGASVQRPWWRRLLRWRGNSA